MRRLALVLSLVVICALAAAGVHFKWVIPGLSAPVPATSRTAVSQPRPVAVEVTQADAVPTTQDLMAIGSLQSEESVSIAPQVAGQIEEIRFQEGQPVKAGDVLVRLDASLTRASAEEMQARFDLADLNLARLQRLASTGTATEQDLDAALAAQRTASALLSFQRVQLSKHDLTAPFDGVIGLRTVSRGSYVVPGAALVNLEKIDTLKVDFKVPEIHMQNVSVGQQVEIAVDALPGRTFQGDVYAIDPMADVNGRSLSVRARLSNPQLELRPGLFARVLIKGRDIRQAVMVPEAAIVSRGEARLIWVVRDGKAEETEVTLGARSNGQVELEGIDAGTTVVTAGHARLRNGATVEIVESEPQLLGQALAQ